MQPGLIKTRKACIVTLLAVASAIISTPIIGSGSRQQCRASGVVRDASGLPASRAEVLATDLRRGVSEPILTSFDVTYHLLLAPGHYRIEVKRSGFARVVIEDLPLVVGERVAKDFTLAVAARRDEVTVEGNPPPLSAGAIVSSSAILSEEFETLPINQRD